MSKYLDNPVFLCGHRKSGTTMLINLFDNAFEAITYPDDSGFFYKYFPEYELEKYSDQEKIERLCSTIAGEKLTEVISNIDISANDKKELFQNQKDFIHKIRSYSKSNFNYKDILLHFIESFRESFYGGRDAKVWIEKTTTTELYALELANKFPNAKFIHIVRDPRDNWASLLSGWDERYKNFNDSKEELLQSMIDRGRLGMEFAKHNLTVLGNDRYKVIRFEDLTSNPEYCMKELSNFVGIEFNENLLTPTVFGHPWYGNNFDGVRRLKPSSENVSKWNSRISQKDAKIIEYYFSDIMDHFQYEKSYSLKDTQLAAAEHYKWFNFSL